MPPQECEHGTAVARAETSVGWHGFEGSGYHRGGEERPWKARDGASAGFHSVGTQRMNSRKPLANSHADILRHRRNKGTEEERPFDSAPTTADESQRRRRREFIADDEERAHRTAVIAARSSSALMCSSRSQRED